MKTILITGASGGIGSEIARTFAKENNKLILIYNSNKEYAENLQLELSTQCAVEIFKCDLTNEKEINSLCTEIISKCKVIDVLINAAGISKFQQIQDTLETDFNQVFDTNVKGPALLTAKISKNMISNQNGRIVFISSIWGNVGASMESLYSASKGAINSLTLALAKELGPSNITVNAVCPGLIDTKMNSLLGSDTISDIVANTPISRIGKPTDVANIVEFLCSDKASFITGQIITVDGGFTL